jgi:serine/threonine-protein kinase
MVADESIPETLGECRLGASLGAGGMGEVFAATHPRYGDVVVKVMHAHLAAEHRARLKREGQVLAKIDSPYVVKVHELGFSDGARSHPFLVMERLYGHTLDDELRERHHLPVERALGIAIDLLRGLAVVHASKLVHRDIKPSNVFLCHPDGRAKLLDFGVVGLLAAVTGVSALPQPTRAGSAVGTPRFMAPEQATAGQIDSRADIYGVGTLLYVMLSGQHVFQQTNPSDVMMAHVVQAPVAPSLRSRQSIAPAIDTIVLKALAKNPADRFQDATRFIEQLTALLPPGAAPADVTAHPGSIEPPTQRLEHGARATELLDPAAPPAGITPLPATQALPEGGPLPAAARSGSGARALPPTVLEMADDNGRAPTGPPAVTSRRPAGLARSWPLWILVALSFVATLALLEGWLLR